MVDKCVHVHSHMHKMKYSSSTKGMKQDPCHNINELEKYLLNQRCHSIMSHYTDSIYITCSEYLNPVDGKQSMWIGEN